ncbi:MAG: heavy-metal-associated domain-containing protein [Muribaculaceae bacterium]|nr:heavy-metal-associated domain-containing protein [Muribaculaceae bacterium]MEE1298596.1 heavy metal-associated domain-containing protein [Muribaculaceae bacterium]
MEKKYKVGGMMCAHCASSVESALKAIGGVESVKIDLLCGTVTVAGNASAEQVAEAIENTGFDFLGEA